MESRRDQYKQHGGSVGGQTTEGQRNRRRKEQIELRKEKRDTLLNGKRMRLDENDDENVDITIEQVREATIKLCKKSDETESLLKLLRQAFAQGTALIDEFLCLDGSMTCLVGLLTGLDPEVQLEAAWCFTNLAAGTDEHAAIVIKHAGAYLVTYLSGGNAPLQDQCAWAVGNLAGGGPECRSTLRAQGAVQPLINLLQLILLKLLTKHLAGRYYGPRVCNFPVRLPSPVITVVQSSAFALSNIARDQDSHIELVAGGILTHLASHFIFAPDRLALITEVGWVLTYLAAAGNHTQDIHSAGLLQKLTLLIITVAENDANKFEVLTPLLRSLGNILCSVSAEVGSELARDKRLMLTLGQLLLSEHLHMRKETLWVISNITVFPVACTEILHTGMLSSIIQLLSTTIDIKKEAAYCLCNMAAQGGAEVCVELLRLGMLEAAVPLLKLVEPDLAHRGLCLVEMIFRTRPDVIFL